MGEKHGWSRLNKAKLYSEHRGAVCETRNREPDAVESLTKYAQRRTEEEHEV